MMNSTGMTTGDNQAYLVPLINYLNKTISQYGLGLILVIGNIGLVLTCVVFYQPTFRRSPCAMYFFASSFSQFFTFNLLLSTRILQYGYDIQAVNIYLWFCKLRFYLFYTLVAIPRYNIIMASIDRYFASSRDALRRQWSSPKIASRFIIGNIIFWSVLYIQVLIFYGIYNDTCQPLPGGYGMFFSIYISVDSGLLPILLMFIFGMLTVRNVHQTRQRIEPTAAGTNENRSGPTSKMSKKDVQLHKMLANQICLFLVMNLPNPCYLMYRAFTLNNPKSPIRRSAETFISNMTYLFVYLGFALTFVNFVISSDMFRREFQYIVRTRILRRPPTRTTTGGGTTVRILRPNDINE